MALLNRILALILGLALAAAGLVVVIETVMAALGQPPLVIDRQLVDRTLSELTWTARETGVALAILIGAGLVLLLPQLVPRTPDTLLLRPRDHRRAEIERRALASMLAARADRDGQVLHTRASIGKRTARVRVKAQPGAELDPIQERLTTELDGSLQALELARGLRPKVFVSRSREQHT